MKKQVSLSLILVFLSGCVSAQIKPPMGSTGKSRKIVVVPMEAPPLEVFLPFVDVIPYNASALMTWVPVTTIQTAGRVGIMFCGIFMLLDLPETARRSASIAASVDNVLDSKAAWMPTVVLSRDAAERIRREGKHALILEEKTRQYPGITNRERTFFGENWMAPMRSWYKQELSSFDYSTYKEQGADAVLEVGLLNYSLYGDGLIVQVVMKIVDPATGKVLGRARNHELATIPDMGGLFGNNGRNFKELFTATARKPITENLQYLGFLAERKEEGISRR